MATPPPDRTLALCDLLLGAAHADSNFHERERTAVRRLLTDASGSAALGAEVEDRLARFDPGRFSVAAAAAAFKSDPIVDKTKILHLVAAVHEADEELDFAEDDYLRALAAALDLPASSLKGLTVEIESEELRETYESVRRPPPVPGSTGATIDVDMDE